MNNKKQLFAVVASAIIIVFCSVIIAQAVTTVGNNISVGGDFAVSGNGTVTGYFGIGTSTPYYPLSVFGDSYFLGNATTTGSGRFDGGLTIGTDKVVKSTTVVAASGSPHTVQSDYSCDGTSDQIEINQAISWVAAQGGGVVQLSSGIFTINGPILLKDAVTLRGEGWFNVVSGTKIQLADGANCNGIESGVADADYVRIEDLHLYGNKINQTGTSNGISDTATKRWTADFNISGVLINHFRDNGIHIVNSPLLRHFTLFQSTLEYFDNGYAVYLDVPDSAGHKMIFSSLDIEANPGGAFYIKGFNAPGRGYASIVNSVVVAGDSYFVNCDYFNITSNVFKNVYFDNCDYLVFTGNNSSVLKVSNTDASGNKGVTISGNTIRYYLDVNTLTDFTITGNSIMQFIQPRHMLRGIIANNKLGNNGDYALYFAAGDDSDYMEITGNNLSKSDGSVNKIFNFPTTGIHNTLINTTNGNVGIGTTTPAFNLEVSSSASTTVMIGSGALTGCFGIGDTDKAGITWCTTLDGVLTCTPAKPQQCK